MDGVHVSSNWPDIAAQMNAAKNAAAKGEAAIHAAGSRVQVWVVPTNEELIVARQSKHLLEG